MAFSGSKPIRLGVILLLALLIFNGLLSYRAVRILRQRRASVRQIYESRLALERLFSLLKDAESGQRGYIYTGDERYLEPYNSAVPQIKAVTDQLDLTFKTSQTSSDLEKQLDDLIGQKL